MENNKRFSRLTLENGYGVKMVWEVDHNDTCAEDYLHGLVSLLVGAAFSEGAVLNAMREYVEEHMPDDRSVTVNFG